MKEATLGRIKDVGNYNDKRKVAQIELKKVSDATVQWRLKNWYCTFAQDCTANNGNIMMQEVYPPQPPGVAGRST